MTTFCGILKLGQAWKQLTHAVRHGYLNMNVCTNYVRSVSQTTEKVRQVWVKSLTADGYTITEHVEGDHLVITGTKP